MSGERTTTNSISIATPTPKQHDEALLEVKRVYYPETQDEHSESVSYGCDSAVVLTNSQQLKCCITLFKVKQVSIPS